MFRASVIYPLVVFLIAATAATADYPVRPVPFTDVHLTGGLWRARQDVDRTVTLPFALQQCEDNGRLRNFDLAAEAMRRRSAGEKDFQNMPASQFPFDDSDLYKVLEGAAYVLALEPDAALEQRIDDCITRIAAAQEPDGYLYTFRTMHPDKALQKRMGAQRWEQEGFGSHELYNLGHLYEAATAYYQATGKRALLDVAVRSAELLWREFGPGKQQVAPGHQGIELGLVKLHRMTGDARWMHLARLFIEARGRVEPRETYRQTHQPVLKQKEAVGHAVRATYLYSGMADVAAMQNDPAYQQAINAIWEDVVAHKIYLTGGVGARQKQESFGDAYELPNDGYNETCAAVGMMMWNHRMFLASGDARYIDVLERTAYNGFLSGQSQSGDRFFYPNPLAYDGVAKHNVGYAGRAPWFGCACCPPNVVRTLASLAGYFYAVQDDRVFVNLYAQSTATIKMGARAITLNQVTEYPWNGVVRLTVSPDAAVKFSMKVRIPGWAQGQPVPFGLYVYDSPVATDWSVAVNGQKVPATTERGYVSISRVWHAGDVVTIDLPMPVRRVRAHEAVFADHGRAALERGPMVFCFEAVDNDGRTLDLTLSDAAVITSTWRPDLLGGVTTLTVADPKGSLTAIPYYAWNNRGLYAMQVWLARKP